MCGRDSFSIDFNDRLGFLGPEKPLITPPKIDVYLAGPLTNIDERLANECDLVRRAVRHVLHGYEYLRVVFNVYDPAEFTAPQTSHTAPEVYTIDHKCTVCSDLVVFLINAPSLGVGIEAQLSAMATTPRIVIRKGSVPLSRMFAGMFCSTIAEITYDHPAEVAEQLRAKLSDICPKVIESVERRRPHLLDLMNERVGERFLMQRLRHGIALQTVAEETDIQEYWLREIELCPELPTTLGFIAVRRISSVLKCCTHQHYDGTIKINDLDCELRPNQTDSLRNLARFVNTHRSVSEDRAFALWARYLNTDERQLKEVALFRHGIEGTTVVTEEEWRRRYDDMDLFD